MDFIAASFVQASASSFAVPGALHEGQGELNAGIFASQSTLQRSHGV